MRSILVCLTTASTVALLTQEPARGQKQDQPRDSRSTSSSSSSQSGSLANSDRTFVTKALADGKKEVATATTAMSMLSDPEVKAFAQRLVDDHTKANQELESLAQKKGVTAPAHTERPEKANGSMTDRSFIAHAVKDHEAAVALFERESHSGSDAEIKDFATKTLPTLREHLTQAKSLQSKGGKTSSPDGKTPTSSNTDPTRKRP